MRSRIRWNIDLSEDEIGKVEKLAREWSCLKEEALHKLVKKGLSFYDNRSEKPWPNFYLLGAPLPWQKSEKSKFIDDLRRRCRIHRIPSKTHSNT